MVRFSDAPGTGGTPGEKNKFHGYGPWNFGMKKAEVTAVAEFGPYLDVKVTGGVETKNGVFLGSGTTISFVFSNDALVRIQIWGYEGKDRQAGIESWFGIYDFLNKNFGSVQSPQLDLSAVTARDQFVKFVEEHLQGPANPDGTFKLQIKTNNTPPGSMIFSSFISHPVHGYYVFLYFTGK
jgi:hypothetical protein